MTTATHDLLRALAALSVWGALTATAASARAAPPERDAPAIDHDEVFRRGFSLYAQGKFLEAIGVWEKLLSSMGEQRGWKVLYNLGLAYQRAGDATRAIERLDAFVRRVAEQPDAINPDLDDRRQDALQRVRALKAEHGALHVIASPGDGVVMVRVGTSKPRPAGGTVYLAPGEHEIELYTGTPRARRVTVRLEAGATRDLELAPASAASPSPSPSPGPGPSPRPTPTNARAFPVGWAIAGGAVSLAAGAVPLVLGLRASNKRDDADRLGAGSTRYASAASDFEKARTLYAVSYAIPAAVAVAAIAVVIIKWSGSDRDTRQATISPCLGAGVCASGRF